MLRVSLRLRFWPVSPEALAEPVALGEGPREGGLALRVLGEESSRP